MELRLLYFEGCPGWKTTQQNLDEVLQELTLNVAYELIDVTGTELPQAFYGSPTINNKKNDSWEDLFGMTGESIMACRTYQQNGQRTPYIPKEMLKERIEELK